MTGPTSARAPLSARIHAQLRAAILAGTYAPGDALPSERRLSDELGASRHAVREALKRLQQSRLVRISQGGATRVRDWRRQGGLDLLIELGSAPDVPHGLGLERAVMEMRASVGADAARRCAARADAVVRAELEARAEMLAAEPEPHARNAIYEAFWDLVIEGADNLAYRLAPNTPTPPRSARSRRASRPATRTAPARALASCSNAPRRADRGRGPLLRDPVLRPAAGGRGALLPPLPRGRPRRLRAQGHAHEHHHGARQRRGQRRLEARRRRGLRRALRADAAAHARGRLVGLGAAILPRRPRVLLVPPHLAREPRLLGQPRRPPLEPPLQPLDGRPADLGADDLPAVLAAAAAARLSALDGPARAGVEPDLPVRPSHGADRAPAEAAGGRAQHAVAPSRPPRRQRAVPRPQLRRDP